MNREFITEFCRELDFPAEAEKALLKAADAVLANQNASDVLHAIKMMKRATSDAVSRRFRQQRSLCR